MACIFLASAFGKVIRFEQAAQYMASHGIPAAGFFCVMAILLEVAGGLSISLGFYTRVGAWALIVFLVPATFIFHLAPDQRIHLLKNLAILGGLLQLAAHGGGRIGLDSGGTA